MKKLKMQKSYIVYQVTLLLCTMILLPGCSNSNKSENGLNPSCLVEDSHSGEIVICFEGDLNFVKSRCKTSDTAAKVTFSVDSGCPRDRGYYGNCVDFDEGYTPFSYDSPSVLAQFTKQQKVWNEEIVHKGNEKDCISNGGKWYWK